MTNIATTTVIPCTTPSIVLYGFVNAQGELVVRKSQVLAWEIAGDEIEGEIYYSASPITLNGVQRENTEVWEIDDTTAVYNIQLDSWDAIAHSAQGEGMDSYTDFVLRTQEMVAKHIAESRRGG